MKNSLKCNLVQYHFQLVEGLVKVGLWKPLSPNFIRSSICRSAGDPGPAVAATLLQLSSSLVSQIFISLVAQSIQVTYTTYLVLTLKVSFMSVPKQNFLAQLATSTLLDRSGLFSLSQLRTVVSFWSDLMGQQPSCRLMVSGSDKTVILRVKGLISTVRVVILVRSTIRQKTQLQVLNLDSSAAPKSCELFRISAYLFCTYWQHSEKQAFLPTSWIQIFCCLMLHSLADTSCLQSGTSIISLRRPSLTFWFYLSIEAVERKDLPPEVQTVLNSIDWPSSLDSVCKIEAEPRRSLFCLTQVSSFLKQGSLICCSLGTNWYWSPILKLAPLISKTRLYSGSQQTMYLMVTESFLKQSLQLILPLERVICWASIRLDSLRLSYFCFRWLEMKSRLVSSEMSSMGWQPQQRSEQTLTSDLVQLWVPTLMNSVSLVSPLMVLSWMLASQIWSLALKKTLKLSCSSDFFSSVLMMTALLRRVLQTDLTWLTACMNWSFSFTASGFTQLYYLMSFTRPSLLSTLMFSLSISEISSLAGESTELSMGLFQSYQLIILFSRMMMLLVRLSLARVTWSGAVELPFSRMSNCWMPPRVYLRTDSMEQFLLSGTAFSRYLQISYEFMSRLKVSRVGYRVTGALETSSMV